MTRTASIPPGPAADAAPDDRPRWLWPRAAYVHVPFCAHHCGYCDFAVAAGKDHLIDRYLDALRAELAMLGSPRPVKTLFIGGGTPTHLGPRQLDRLLADLAAWLPLGRSGSFEFTIEANPDDLDAERLAVLAEHGVQRISIGVQSFHPSLLQVLERRHDPADVPRAVERARRHVPQVALDLIFGVPGQTEAQWQADLRQALALAPDHVSTYGLTYEKGTRLWKQRYRGQLLPLAEESELAFYERAIDFLEAAGFEHYEISNFARPGRRSRHNETYWANEAYFGFGVGAARYVDGCRELNTRSLEEYIRRISRGETATFQSEILPPEERARETMVLQLRQADGIHRAAFRRQTGFDLDALAKAQLTPLIELELLDDDGATIRLTRRGKHVADAIVSRLL